jgi:PhnB protein
MTPLFPISIRPPSLGAVRAVLSGPRIGRDWPPTRRCSPSGRFPSEGSFHRPCSSCCSSAVFSLESSPKGGQCGRGDTAHCRRDAARAAEWYGHAFGAEIGSRIPVPDGRFIQIALVFGDSNVMIADEFPEFGAVSPLTLGGTYGALTITTDAVDEPWERALAHGAEVHSPLHDAFWGERHGQIIDPFGHRWGLAQRLEDVPHDEVVRRAAELFGAAAS